MNSVEMLERALTSTDVEETLKLTNYKSLDRQEQVILTGFFFMPVFPERKKHSSTKLILIIILFLWDFQVDVVTTWGYPPRIFTKIED